MIHLIVFCLCCASAAEQSMKLDLEQQLLAAVADGNSTELKRLVIKSTMFVIALEF